MKIEVESFNIYPNPFYIEKPDENGIYFTVEFKIALKSSVPGPVTDQQLNNLGFYFTQSPGELNYPYGLLSFDIYDPDRKKLEHKGYPDMTAGVDIDPWLINRPNYGDIDPNTPNKGDEDKENDYGNLIAFLKDGNGNYYAEYGYFESGWSNPKGVYTHRLSVELVSLGWKYVEDKGYHAEPDYRHYGLRSDVIDRQFEAKEDEPPAPQDTTPPSVSTTDPTAGAEKEQGKVIRVSATLSDNQGGVGVNISASKIWLLDSDNVDVPGYLTNNGVDTIYWNLEGALNTPGSYTIKITAVDKRPNTGSYTICFTVKDKMAPEITQTDPADNETITTTPFDGFILVWVSDEDTGKSAIDWNKTEMYFESAKIPATHTETGSYEGFLAGTIRELTESGTYTITVWVYDVWGNGTSCSFSFVIPEQIVVTDPNGNTLELPYDTEIDFGKGTSVGS
ncbi:MAG: Ig-like domain-containing protein, partial [Candidatus Desantisbacteria bacterium]